MAAEWYYSKGSQQHGPVSASDLKILAKSGALLPTDMVWKEGMAEWKPASNVKGLCASTPVPAAESPKAPPASPKIKTPPIVPEMAPKQSLAEAAKGAARGAAQYAAKQTERAKLMNLTLPPLYQALGRYAFSSPDFRAEFAEVFQQLDQVQAEQSEIKRRTPVATKSFGDKAKAMAGQAMDAAQSQKSSLRQSSLFGTLGKAVYDKHEDASGPHELVKPIADTVARIAMLDGDLNALSSSKDGSWVTPKRLATAVGVAIVLTVLVLVVKREDPKNAEIAQTDRGDGQANESARTSDALTEDYFPMGTGTERYFSLRSYSEANRKIARSPLTIRTEDRASKWFELRPDLEDLYKKGSKHYVWYRPGNGKIKLTDIGTYSIVFRKTEMGVMRCDSIGSGKTLVGYEVLWFKWGAKPGDKWDTKIQGNRILESARYDKNETVSGIECAVVTISRSDSGHLADRRSRYWLAKGVGIIRQANYSLKENSWMPFNEQIYSELKSDIAPLDWESKYR